MDILTYAPALIAVVAMILFSIISAYVRVFNIKKSGLTQDYFVFAIFIIIALKVGGAI